jgi:predicted dehydrogenase
MPFRAAVVGCGALANGAHLPNIAANPEFELIVTCDALPEAASAAAERWGAARTTTDWREVVAADDIDVIVLCTHTDLRADLICAACDAGKPVYTEKPLADSRDACRRILAATRRTGVPVCVGHNRRSSPAMLEMRRLLRKAREQGADRAAIIDRQDEHGPVVAEADQTQLLIRVNDDIRTWKGWIFTDDSGIILAEMVHFIDLALWLLPGRPVEGYVSGSPRGNFTELIRFDDGSLATLQHTLVGNFDYPKELIEATSRHVTIAVDHHMEVRQRGLEDEPFRTCYPLGAGGELVSSEGVDAFNDACDKLQALRAAGEPLPCAAASPNKGHADQLDRFRRHVLGDGENPCSAASAVAVTNVALKLLESSRLGQPVRIGPEDWDV